MIIGIIVCGSNLFFYCYFGQLATVSYTKIADCLFESELYNQSTDYQKNLVLMIRIAQKATYYHGFGVAYLNLDTFGRV